LDYQKILLRSVNFSEYFDMWGDTYVAAIGTADVYVTEMGV